MHPNPIFRGEPDFTNIAFCRRRGFGALLVNGREHPLVSHIPFVLSEDGRTADMHLVRSNSIARASLEQGNPLSAVLTVNGPDGYISPDWYGLEDQVPTWNYVAVQLTGTLVAQAPELLRGQLDAISGAFEATLAPKRPWTSDKMSDGVMERMMRQVLPFRLLVEKVEGTWKLGQNKAPEARDAAARELRHSPTGHEVETLSALMTGGVPEIDKSQPFTYMRNKPKL